MTRTHYDDSTGLSPRNVSTANDLAKLVRAAAEYPLIREYSTTPSHYVEVQPTGQTLGFNNSNALVKNSAWDIQLQKTGYIREAGRCVVMLVEHRQQADGDRAARLDRQVHARWATRSASSTGSKRARRCRWRQARAQARPESRVAKGDQAREGESRAGSCPSRRRAADPRNRASRRAPVLLVQLLGMSARLRGDRRAAQHPSPAPRRAPRARQPRDRSRRRHRVLALVTRKCVSANAATCGKCVTHSTWRRAPAPAGAGPPSRRPRRRCRLSTSSNTSVGTDPASLATTEMASAMRDSSPPEATRESGPGACFGWLGDAELDLLQTVARRGRERLQRDVQPAARHRERLHRVGDAMRELVGGEVALFREMRRRVAILAFRFAARLARASASADSASAASRASVSASSAGSASGRTRCLRAMSWMAARRSSTRFSSAGSRIEPALVVAQRACRFVELDAAGSSSATTSESAGSCATAVRSRCVSCASRTVSASSASASAATPSSAAAISSAACARRDCDGGQLRPFVVGHRERGELALPLIEKFALRGAGLRRVRGRVAPFERRAPGAPAVGDLARERGEAAEGVDEVALRLGLAERLVRVLAVDRDEQLAQLDFSCASVAGAAVDPCAAAALRVEHAAQQHLVVVAARARARPATRAPSGSSAMSNLGGELGTLGARAQLAELEAVAEQQAERVEEDRLAGAGFAGQHREARAELDVERLARRRSCGSRASAASGAWLGAGDVLRRCAPVQLLAQHREIVVAFRVQEARARLARGAASRGRLRQARSAPGRRSGRRRRGLHHGDGDAGSRRRSRSADA